MVRHLSGCALTRAAASLLAFWAVADVATASAKPREKKTVQATVIPPAQLAAPPTNAPVRFFTISDVLARHDGRAPPRGPMKLASIESTTVTSDAAVTSPVAKTMGSEPFGLSAFRAPEGLLWKKWRAVQAEIKRENGEFARCRESSAECSPTIANFQAIVEAARSQERLRALDLVNRRINTAIRYVNDYAHHGVPDQWSAPLATLTAGMGDCEDYAIAKYVALQEAGFAATDLRLLLVRDRAVRQDHAVLAVRSDDRWLILDNRSTDLREDSAFEHFTPLFALDERGVNLFSSPYASKFGAQTPDMAPAASVTPPPDSWVEADAVMPAVSLPHWTGIEQPGEVAELSRM